MVAILVDITKCSGCEKCIAACIKSNNLNEEKASFDRVLSKDGLSDNRLLSIINVGEGRFARLSCMHCVHPNCVSACLVGGITKSKEGPVIYDPDKCIGCRYCMLACPFQIPRYEWSATKPFMKKCNLCYDLLKRGSVPACVRACPNNAITFGERKDMINKARNIINSEKEKYINHIWGEKEYGGTSLMYISDVNLSKLGWPARNVKPISSLTDPLIEKTPIVGFSVAGSLIGVSWIIKRRMQLAKEKSENSNNKYKNDE